MVGNMKTSTAILTSEDWLECSCGNAPHTSGFYPCRNINGKWVECEPTPEEWIRENYWCSQCDAVYDITDKSVDFYKDIRFYYCEGK